MGVRGFGPLLAVGSLSPSPPASRHWDAVVGLELPIGPRLPWGCAGVPTPGLSPGDMRWPLGRHLAPLWGAVPLTFGDLSV